MRFLRTYLLILGAFLIGFAGCRISFDLGDDSSVTTIPSTDTNSSYTNYNTNDCTNYCTNNYTNWCTNTYDTNYCTNGCTNYTTNYNTNSTTTTSTSTTTTTVCVPPATNYYALTILITNVPSVIETSSPAGYFYPYESVWSDTYGSNWLTNRAVITGNLGCMHSDTNRNWDPVYGLAMTINPYALTAVITLEIPMNQAFAGPVSFKMASSLGWNYGEEVTNEHSVVLPTNTTSSHVHVVFH